jgi:heptose I phosphotransferase
MITLCPALQTRFAESDAFDQVLAMEGRIFRRVKGRTTLRFEHDGKGYFLKIHTGVGWGEILKNLLHGKAPTLSAKDEYEAIQALGHLGVETMKIAGFGLRGKFPASLQSFLITEEIADVISLEELAHLWSVKPPEPRFKRKLIGKVADIARTMHRHGMSHRDFYLCHFLLEKAWLVEKDGEGEPHIHVIDLHRCRIHRVLPERWRLKDLAGLHFSSMDAGLTQRDRLRFLCRYECAGIREVVQSLPGLWVKVDKKATRLYGKFRRRKG